MAFLKRLVRHVLLWLGYDVVRVTKDARFGGTTVRPKTSPTGDTFWAMSPTQEMFCEWNAERLGITIQESRDRYLRSWRAIENGHRGREFYAYNVQAHEIFSVFFDDNPREVYESYSFHGYMHFLMMLTYEETTWEGAHSFNECLADRSSVRILDFGCGLAQRSRSLAQFCSDQGKQVELVLADIPTVRKHFLVWLGERTGIPMTFLDCTLERPIPPLPGCDLCFATEVFEHFHDPVSYFRAIDGALMPGGFLVTDVTDHSEEFMHVSPDLSSIRQELSDRGYDEVRPDTLFRKQMART